MIYGMGLPELLIVVLAYLPGLVTSVLVIVVLILAIRWLIHQEQDRRAYKEKTADVRKSLAQVIADHRKACNMTQEFVARELGVSRQAVSKWEAGTSEPSTTNLMGLAKLFGMEPADLLREVGEQKR